MKSIRLNKKLREEIVSNIRQAYLIKTPHPEYKEKSAWFYELVVPVMRKQYQERAAAAMRKLESVGITSTSINTNWGFNYAIDGVFAANVHHLINGDIHDQYASENYLIQLDSGTSFDLTKDMPGELGDAYREYLSKTKRLKAAKEARDKAELKLKNYMADVKNVIEVVNTTSQLLEAWPECERFIPHTIVDPSGINLPASVSISQLNKCI